MKKIIAILLLSLTVLGAASCATEDKLTGSMFTRQYYTFEGTLDLATDVVIAEYNESRTAEEQLLLHNFTVREQVYGEAPESLDIYVENANLEVINGSDSFVYNASSVTFEKGKTYMLVLEKSDYNGVYQKIVPYILLNEIMIDMSDFSQSRMYCQPIEQHAKGIQFAKDLKEEDLIDYVKQITSDNEPRSYPTRDYIHSEDMDVILRGSPIVAKVRVEELDYATRSALLDIDVYQCTVTETLKGKLEVGEKVVVTFFADTVNKGGEYIVAVQVINEGDDSSAPACYLTSKNSLFDVADEDVIIQHITDNE